MKPSDFPLASPQRAEAEAAKALRDKTVAQNEAEHDRGLIAACDERQAGLDEVNARYRELKAALRRAHENADKQADRLYHETLEQIVAQATPKDHA